jgi:hypothetical protein
MLHFMMSSRFHQSALPGDAAADMFSDVAEPNYAIGGGNALHAICTLRCAALVSLLLAVSPVLPIKLSSACSPYSIHVSKIIIGHLNSGSNKTVPGLAAPCPSLVSFLTAFAGC